MRDDVSSKNITLVKKYHDTHCEDKEVLISINKVIDASPELCSKKLLIETFIAGINDADDIMDEWHSYVAEQREADLAMLIIAEKLKSDEIRKFVENAFRDGEIKTASTGTRSLALFYYWYIRMQKASFVFIDEFDAFYHFELSESVEKSLKDIQGVQIFTTTHNTDLMSNDLLRPDCYYILKDNKIKAISELTEKELRFAHNLQKMYKAGAFNS